EWCQAGIPGLGVSVPDGVRPGLVPPVAVPTVSGRDSALATGRSSTRGVSPGLSAAPTPSVTRNPGLPPSGATVRATRAAARHHPRLTPEPRPDTGRTGRGLPLLAEGADVDLEGPCGTGLACQPDGAHGHVVRGEEEIVGFVGHGFAGARQVDDGVDRDQR